MALFLKMLWDNRKALLYILLAIALSAALWRVSVWRDAYTRIGIVEARLAAETACAVDSKCHKRAATLAEQARQEAALAAQEALQAAQEAEAKARANAAEWKRRYQAALRDDPGCADWANAPIRCPL